MAVSIDCIQPHLQTAVAAGTVVVAVVFGIVVAVEPGAAAAVVVIHSLAAVPSQPSDASPSGLNSLLAAVQMLDAQPHPSAC